MNLWDFWVFGYVKMWGCSLSECVNIGICVSEHLIICVTVLICILLCVHSCTWLWLHSYVDWYMNMFMCEWMLSAVFCVWAYLRQWICWHLSLTKFECPVIWSECYLCVNVCACKQVNVNVLICMNVRMCSYMCLNAWVCFWK